MDRFDHPDSEKAQDVQLHGKRLRKKSAKAAFTRRRRERQKQAGASKRKGTIAGSYSKTHRKGYEDMLEESQEY